MEYLGYQRLACIIYVYVLVIYCGPNNNTFKLFLKDHMRFEYYVSIFHVYVMIKCTVNLIFFLSKTSKCCEECAQSKWTLCANCKGMQGACTSFK